MTNKTYNSVSEMLRKSPHQWQREIADELDLKAPARKCFLECLFWLDNQGISVDSDKLREFFDKAIEYERERVATERATPESQGG